MITIRDWLPIVPPEEKSIGYVGEDRSVQRQFLLTGEEWETYRNWSFYLDMAFDLSSVTHTETFQREVTKQTENENMTASESTETTAEENGLQTGMETQSVQSTKSESGSTETESHADSTASVTVTKETHTIVGVVVDCDYSTDVAPLDKAITADGLLLTWHILRQQTRLPGRLQANIRAVSPAGEIKKSDVMLLWVEPSVAATAAGAVPISEYEQMEQRMGVLVEEAHTSALRAEESAALVYAKAVSVGQMQNDVNNKAAAVNTQATFVREVATQVAEACSAAENAAAAALEAAETVQVDAAIVSEQTALAVQAAAEAAASAAEAASAAGWREACANAVIGTVDGRAVRIDDLSPLCQDVVLTMAADNLLPYPFTETTKTQAGITFTDNGDGSVTVNGTNQEEYVIFRIAEGISLPAGSYTLYGGPDVPQGTVIFSGQTFSESPGGKPISITLTQSETVEVFISVQRAEHLTVTPRITQERTVKVCGKNLLPTVYKGRVTTGDGITFTDNGDGSVTVIGTATKLAQFKINGENMLLPPGRYIVSGGINGTIRRADGTSGWFTLTAPAFELREGDYISHMYLNISAGTTVDTTYYPMLELADRVTAYEPQRAPAVYTADADGVVTVSLAAGGSNTLLADVPLQGTYHRDVNRIVYDLLERVAALERK